jgi:hypothetical protein
MLHGNIKLARAYKDLGFKNKALNTFQAQSFFTGQAISPVCLIQGILEIPAFHIYLTYADMGAYL